MTAPTEPLGVVAFLQRWERNDLPDGLYAANSTVRRDRLGGDAGIMAFEGGTLVGHVGYNVTDAAGFYAHSLTSWGSPSVAARLVKRIRLLARSLGYADVLFHVQEPNTSLLDLAPRHASVVSAFLRMKA